MRWGSTPPGTTDQMMEGSLEEEGTYGTVPKKVHAAKWAEPEPYVKRERKTKMYASYAISDKCELHALVLDKYDRRVKKDHRHHQHPQQDHPGLLLLLQNIRRQK